MGNARKSPRTLALALARLVLVRETILRHAQSHLLNPELLELPAHASALDLWMAVLRRAEAEGTLVALVEGVLEENPASQAVRKAFVEWTELGTQEAAGERAPELAIKSDPAPPPKRARPYAITAVGATLALGLAVALGGRGRDSPGNATPAASTKGGDADGEASRERESGQGDKPAGNRNVPGSALAPGQGGARMSEGKAAQAAGGTKSRPAAAASSLPVGTTRLICSCEGEKPRSLCTQFDCDVTSLFVLSEACQQRLCKSRRQWDFPSCQANAPQCSSSSPRSSKKPEASRDVPSPAPTSTDTGIQTPGLEQNAR